MTELFIENKRLDITSELAYLLTFAIDDIKEFGSRNTTFSKTIVLPGTTNNKFLFGNIFDVTVSNPYNDASDNVGTNFNPAKDAECIAFNDRLQVFKGTIRLLEMVIDGGNVEFEVALFGELGGLVNSIGSAKLEDLDFSAYDQLWNGANVTGSWENVTGGGAYFPLADYGGVSVAKVNYDIKACRPALFVKEYIDKIFSNAGYRYSSDLMDTARFKSLIIPNNEKELYNRQFNALYIGVTSFSYDSTEGLATKRAGFGIQTTLGGFAASDSNRIFTYTGTSFTAYLNFIGHITFTNTSGLPFVVNVKQNGVTVNSVSIFGVSSPYTWTITPQLLTVSSGDYFELEVDGPASGTWSFNFSTGQTFMYLEYEYAQPVPLNYNELIRINGSIPRNILQVDFLRNILRLFNLYVYENKLDSKKVYIEPYVDYYDLNVSGVVDWTYKVDRSKPIRIKPMSELNARYYIFKYKDDKDYYNELYKSRYNSAYGDYTYDSAYEFSDDKTEVPLIFSGTPLVGYSGADKIVSTYFKLNAGVEERTDTNIRILQAKKITGVTSWNMLNGASTLISGLTVYGYAGHYDDPDAPANDIQFGVPEELFFTLATGGINVTQFNVYWSPYMAEITDKDSKLMSCYVKLSASDIFNLDFSKLVYIDGAYWRLNKIEDWNVNEPDVCKAEFLKVINTVY